jgi:hypothetical protein
MISDLQRRTSMPDKDSFKALYEKAGRNLGYAILEEKKAKRATRIEGTDAGAPFLVAAEKYTQQARRLATRAAALEKKAKRTRR